MTLLEREPCLTDGLSLIAYTPEVTDIRAQIAAALIDLGITSEPLPFETLHERVRPEDQQPGQGLLGAPTIQNDPAIRDSYLKLVRWLAREVLGFDVVFEANPPIRFHWPMQMPDRFRSPEGTLLCHHSDIMGGDPIEQLNGWLPLTDCRRTNALAYIPFIASQRLLIRFASRLGFDLRQLAQSRHRFYEELCTDGPFRKELLETAKPLEMDYGTVAIFDARLIHGTTENVEDATRVSIDFRLLPVTAYEVLARAWANGEKPPSSRWADPLKGGFYDERSAFEL